MESKWRKDRNSIYAFESNSRDFTWVPAVVDMAALRNAMVELNGNPDLVNPQVPVDLVIDHSVQVDYSVRSQMLRNLI